MNPLIVTVISNPAAGSMNKAISRGVRNPPPTKKMIHNKPNKIIKMNPIIETVISNPATGSMNTAISRGGRNLQPTIKR